MSAFRFITACLAAGVLVVSPVAHAAAVDQPGPSPQLPDADSVVAPLLRHPVARSGSDSCTSGSGKSDFEKGFKQAKLTFDRLFKNLDKDCIELDALYKKVNKQNPYKNLCLREGFTAGAEEYYNNAQDDCVSECAGSGTDTGKMLGMQFCSITDMGAQAASAQDSETVQICNAVESTLCYTTFEDYVASNCPRAQAQNPDFFNSLSEACSITSSRR